MTSAAVKRARQEGFQYTGVTSRGSWDKDKVLERVSEYKVNGNKVRVLLERDVTEFRHEKRIHTYWSLYVKYSEEYLAEQKKIREQREIERRQAALRRMADECTLEELQFMMNYKIASAMQKMTESANEVQS